MILMSLSLLQPILVVIINLQETLYPIQTFSEKTKYIDIYCHIICEKVQTKADLFSFHKICKTTYWYLHQVTWYENFNVLIYKFRVL